MNLSNYLISLSKGIFASAVVIIVFFIPFNFDGEGGTNVFGYTTSLFVNISSKFLPWLILIIMYGSLAGFVGARILKTPRLVQFYEHEHSQSWILYLLGAVFMTLWHFQIGPNWFLAESISGTVIEAIVFQVFFIILLGGVLLPLVIYYGLADFIGTLIEPLMRPVFRVPGRASIDAITSFVTSSSLAVYLTSTFYKQNLYSRREAAIIATSFSAVSVGFASLSVSTLNMSEDFNLIYFSSLFLAFIVAAIVLRLPPLSKMPDTYYSDEAIPETDIESDTSLLRRSVNAAVQRIDATPGIVQVVKKSFINSLMIVPKVIPLLCAVGISGLIIAEHTPLFDWLGLLIHPLLVLLQIPDADVLAPAILVGFCEMYLPVLMVADQAISEQARFFLLTVALVQIIFLSETVVVMISTKIPLEFWQIVVIFLQRTLVALPFSALLSHVFY